jgi:hypothetical protein
MSTAAAKRARLRLDQRRRSVMTANDQVERPRYAAVYEALYRSRPLQPLVRRCTHGLTGLIARKLTTKRWLLATNVSTSKGNEASHEPETSVGFESSSHFALEPNRHISAAAVVIADSPDKVPRLRGQSRFEGRQ